MKDQDGQPLRIVTLPMPGPVYYEGQRLPASYANFAVPNWRGDQALFAASGSSDRHASREGKSQQ
jgi:hypothetical protein